MTAAKKPAARKRRTGPVAATTKKPVEPPDSIEAVYRDYIAIALRYKRREIDRHQTVRERQVLEARLAALTGGTAA